MHARLEDVRQFVGSESLLSFYNRLTEDGGLPDDFPSYAAALTYHGKEQRDPPTSYLSRIVETFPQINAQWLLTGIGKSTRAEQIADRADTEGREQPNRELQQTLEDAFRRGLPIWPVLDNLQREVWEVWMRATNRILETQSQGRTVTQKEVDDAPAVAAIAVGRAFMAPLEHLGIDVGDLMGEQLTNYITALSLALRQLYHQRQLPLRSSRSDVDFDAFTK